MIMIKSKKNAHKEHSSADHATPCLLVTHFFPATTWHMTVGPKSGFRITFQFQFEVRNGHKTFTKQETMKIPAFHHPDDPLFDILKKKYRIYSEKNLLGHLRKRTIWGNWPYFLLI